MGYIYLAADHELYLAWIHGHALASQQLIVQEIHLLIELYGALAVLLVAVVALIRSFVQMDNHSAVQFSGKAARLTQKLGTAAEGGVSAHHTADMGTRLHLLLGELIVFHERRLSQLA